MSLHQEQLGSTSHNRYRSGDRRWAKKQMNRRIRRAEKRDPENAPVRKRFRGWP